MEKIIVKTFDENSSDKLQKSIIDFMKDKYLAIMDIKYSSHCFENGQEESFNSLIVFKEIND